MNGLKQFLAEANVRQPKKGMVGVETDWKPLAEFALEGGRFLVCDFQFIPSEEDGVVVDAVPGTYVAEAKGIDFDGDRRISRLRIFQRDTAPVLGKEIGETWTDTAYSAVCGLDRFSKEWSSLGEDAAADKLQEEYGVEECGVFRLSPQGCAVYYVSSGFGDGTFPVFELCADSGRVGFEIQFIAANEPYPFGPSTASHPPTEEQKAGEERREETWKKLGEMLNVVEKGKTGDKRADRKKLADALGSFMSGLENEALIQIEPLRKHFQQVRRKSLPLTMEYRPVADTSWLSEGPVLARVAALESAGFLQVGCFQPATLSSNRVGFVQPQQGCSASVIKTKSTVSLHIGYAFADRTEDEFTDHPTKGVQFLPPWLHYVSRPDLSPSELVDLASRERRQGPLKMATPTDYAIDAEESWARLVAWRAETGGQPLEYFRQQFQFTDSHEDVERLQMMRRDEVEKSLCNWLRLQPNLPFKVAEILDSVVIVHDELSPSNLAAAWWCGTNDIRVRENEFPAGNPREAFADVNRKRGSKLRLVLEKQTGFPADFYLPAEV